ncbi:MAG: CNT family concentrative nucleoside transporter [Saprospiraceae bacterium]|jgi:CNT family concentrative nucleoside transporter
MIVAVLRAVLGVAIIIGICTLLSSNRKHINWKLVGSGILIQLILAFSVIKIPFMTAFFRQIVNIFLVVIQAAQESAVFLFGDLAKNAVFGFAFSVLPIIIFFSALTSLFYYYGILQRIVYGFAWIMNKTMKLSGAESLAAAANIFIGQTEAPLVIKPYLDKMTRSELMSVMTGGMATIAGSVFGAYISILGGDDPVAQQEFGMHLLVASLISAPAALLIAKILVPENPDQITNTDITVPKSEAGSNMLDALARGTTDGTKLAVNVGVMLFSFMALIYFCNNILGLIGEATSLNAWVFHATGGKFDGLSMQLFMGYLFAPLAWIIGIASDEILLVGQLLGEKTILNEFVAYASLGEMSESGALSKRSTIIAAYALCGFANFASIGIQIGGISSLAPSRRVALTELGFKALIGGTAATLLTGCLAGALI